MGTAISHVATNTFSRNYLPGEQPICCRCLQQVEIDAYYPACYDGTKEFRKMPGYEMASCTLQYGGQERAAILCASCHKQILVAEEKAARETPCHCSRCGQERGPYAWSSGRYSPFGTCEACFVGRVQLVTDVINAQAGGPLTTLLAMATGDFDPSVPSARPSKATQERSWAYLEGNSRPVRHWRVARGKS